jgi:DMSO/TMAO reductase YedYZ molybdopterin-dependent catalytic subunit
MRSVELKWRHRPAAAGALCLLLAGFGSHPGLASDSGASGGQSARADAISIDGAVEHPKTLTLADLKQAPATTETVALKTGKGVLTGSYTGVLLWTLIQQAAIKQPPDSKNDVLRHTIVVTSSDGYSAVLSAAEISPEFGDDRAIIAYAKDGQPLSDKRGFARLILPADKSAGRAISGVATITVH